MKSTTKKYLFIILIFTILILLCYLSIKRNRNSKKEGLYSINNFIRDFQTINGHIKEVREAKKKAEFALYSDDRYNEENDDDKNW